MKYTVIINESRRVAVEIDAESELMALNSVTDDYCDGTIKSTENDIASVDIVLEII